MYYYRVYGMKVISDREIVQLLSEERALELDRAEGIDNSNIPTITIKQGVSDEVKGRERVDKIWDINDTDSWLFNRTCYLNVKNGNEILYEMKPEGNDLKLNSYLLGFGLSIIGYQREFIPIHSSGLMKGNNAILISGDSGAGKSTLTASLIDRGYDLMADDITFVKKDEAGLPLAYAGFPYQKLCRNEVEKRHSGEDGLIYIDEDKDKFLVPWRGDFTTNSRPLRALIFIAPTDVENVEVTEIKGFEKIPALHICLFMRRLLEDYKSSRRVTEKLLWFASKVPILLVKRPTDRNTIEEIADKTEEFIKKYMM